MFKKLMIGDLVADMPIIQGGMGIGVSLSGLASAVANQGGIGIISAVAPGFRDPDLYAHYKESNIKALKEEIQKARNLSKGIIGVNIMVALTNYEDMVKTAIECEADIIISGAGLPLSLPQYKPASSKTKLVPIVSSARAARLIFKRWIDKFNYVPDAVVVEGPESGGHQGVKLENLTSEEFSLETLIPEVLETVKIFEEKTNRKIPVIAAGGIYTGADILKFMKMGASGVQMGTRFITTDECDASLNFKNAFLKCDEKKDIIVIQSPVGLPLRVMKNSFVDKALKSEKKPVSCPFHCLVTCDYKNVTFCISKALMNAQKGIMEDAVICSGTNGYKSTKIISVKELIENLSGEYEAALRN